MNSLIKFQTQTLHEISKRLTFPLSTPIYHWMLFMIVSSIHNDMCKIDQIHQPTSWLKQQDLRLLFACVIFSAISQIAKIFGSTSIRHRSDTKVSDRCLIDIDLRGLKRQLGTKDSSMPHSVSDMIKPYQEILSVSCLCFFSHRVRKVFNQWEKTLHLQPTD